MNQRVNVSEQHRRRRAVVYVRQSTLAQIERNVESQARQYALAERAVELGWPAESVAVVDEDSGRSGKGTMCEAELHLIRSRLEGGLRHKAEQGELRLHPAVGFDRDEDGQVVLSADEQVRHAIEWVSLSGGGWARPARWSRS